MSDSINNKYCDINNCWLVWPAGIGVTTHNHTRDIFLSNGAPECGMEWAFARGGLEGVEIVTRKCGKRTSYEILKMDEANTDYHCLGYCWPKIVLYIKDGRKD